MRRPDITPAQLVALVPVFALLLRAFGVYDLNREQQDALEAAVAAVAVLILGDAAIRHGRSRALPTVLHQEEQPPGYRGVERVPGD